MKNATLKLHGLEKLPPPDEGLLNARTMVILEEPTQKILFIGCRRLEKI